MCRFIWPLAFPWRRSGRHGLVEDRLAALDGDDRGGLRGVAVRIDVRDARDPGEIPRRGQRIAQLGPVGAAGALDGVDQDAGHPGLQREAHQADYAVFDGSDAGLLEDASAMSVSSVWGT